MANYVIAIGGTGARFLESLIHLSAAGLGPNGKIFSVIVDPDNGNGNINRVANIFLRYAKCREILSQFIGDEDIPIFKTEIISCDNIGNISDNSLCIWSPVRGNVNNLEQYFDYFGLLPEYRELCSLLYTEKERKELWDQGFKGRANLGAPVMADIKNHLNCLPWSTFIEDIKVNLQNDICNIFIVGSIFGATGASGFPTVAKILKEKSEEESDPWPNLQNLRIGGSLVLPYFYLRVQDEAGEESLYADPRDFLINTKAALLHYANVWQNTSPFNRVYFVGDQPIHQEFQEFAAGGMRQENPLTYVDLIVASAFLHFVKNTPPLGGGTQYYYSGRNIFPTVSWEDLPCPDLMKNILILATLAMSYKEFFNPLINNPKFDKKRILVPWYTKYFDKGELNNKDAISKQKEILAYLNDFVDFIKQIQNATNNGLNVKLFQDQALEDSDFGKLPLDMKSEVNYPNDKIFEILCRRDWQKKGEASARLFSMLYGASNEFCHKYLIK